MVNICATYLVILFQFEVALHSDARAEGDGHCLIETGAWALGEHT
jgi:hypothetical protein